jgi:hypothetical protein
VLTQAGKEAEHTLLIAQSACLVFLLLYLIAMSAYKLAVLTGAVDSPGKEGLAFAGVSAFTEVI